MRVCAGAGFLLHRKRLMKRVLVIVVACAGAGCFPWRAPERMTEFTSVEAALQQPEAVRYVNLYGKGLADLPVELRQLPS